MSALRRLLTVSITTDRDDARLGSYLFFAAAIGLLYVCVRRVATLQLNEQQLFLAMLVVFTAVMSMVGIGLLLAMKSKTHE